MSLCFNRPQQPTISSPTLAKTIAPPESINIFCGSESIFKSISSGSKYASIHSKLSSLKASENSGEKSNNSYSFCMKNYPTDYINPCKSPSTLRAWPEILLPSGDATNATKSASCLGSINSFMDAIDNQVLVKSSAVWPLAFAFS